MTSRHRRTPSAPLRVRTASVSYNHSNDEEYTATDNADSLILSPSSADIPSALPSITPPSVPATSGIPVESSTKSSEKYGFVVYAGSLVAWWMYLFWALTPDAYLKKLGLEWYPSREWAILIPCFLMVAVVYVYVAYFALNLYYTPPLDALECIVDTQANLLPSKDDAKYAGQKKEIRYTVGRDPNDDHIPPLYDLPVGMINRAVFG